MYDFVIVGGGIVGLATAYALTQQAPTAKLLVLEKEADWAQHQTGNNSGVIHSGIYYKPGSLKATLCREGNRSMVEFCRTHAIPVDLCGKVIVATEESELARLEALYQRGLENELEVRKLTPEEVKAIEPHVRCLAGIGVPSTGITSYKQVSRKLAELVAAAGGELRLGTEVTALHERGDRMVVETTHGEFQAGMLINCGGLHSDRLAKMAGKDPGARIVPFRGEYYELVPAKRDLVKTLIYPVPNPDFPFLGVHFTRMIDGSVHAGPNAVLSLKREGYHKTDVSLRDMWDTLTFTGFWRFASKHMGEGMMELHRSFSKRAFVESLQRLIPEVKDEDLVPCHAGVRAQALTTDGKLVDDFLIVEGPRSLHVCNAPSPAATASLAIGKAIVARIPADRLNGPATEG